jgi:hypothetical protein
VRNVHEVGFKLVAMPQLGSSTAMLEDGPLVVLPKYIIIDVYDIHTYYL